MDEGPWLSSSNDGHDGSFSCELHGKDAESKSDGSRAGGDGSADTVKIRGRARTKKGRFDLVEE